MGALRGVILAALATQQSVASAACTYDFPDRSVVYDFSSLMGQVFPYLFSSTMDFRYSLCSNAPGFACAGLPSVSVLLDRQGGSACTSSYGRAENVSVSLLSEDPTAGIRITYSAGSACPLSPGRTLFSVFNVACDPSKTSPVATSMSIIPLCGIQYNILSALGCGRKYVPVRDAPSVGWYVFLGVLGAGLVYLGTGIAYKRRVYGATGFEAVPNIGTWRTLYGYTVQPVVERLGRRNVMPDDYALAPGGEMDGEQG